MARLVKNGAAKLAATLLLAGCAGGSGAVPTPATRISLDPAEVEPMGASAAAPSEGSAGDPLPPLAVEHAAGFEEDELRIDVFATPGDTDVRTVLASLAQGLGLDYRIAPEVRGTVNARFEDASLDDVLREVVEPLGYEYQIQNRVLVVGPARIESQVFLLDYVAISRVGQGSTVVQRRIGGGGGGGAQGVSFGGGGGGGSDFITSTTVADLWADIRVALETLVFGPSEQLAILLQDVDADAEPDVAATVATQGVTPQTSANRGGVGGIGGFGGGSQAYSRADEMGRSLIINPMAGTIHVKATPDVLVQVEEYVDIFEASVQRQVLIEAKIVEVQLSRGYEFGIDWGAIQALGDVNLRMGTVASQEGGLQFTLDGGMTQIAAVLQTLEQQGDVRVLSSPQVSALNNQRALFDVTTDEVLFTVNRQPVTGPNGGTIAFTNEIVTNQISVGIVLDVVPQIGADNTVSMSVRPTITNVARVETIQTPDGGEARAPVIDRRSVDTFVRVRPGETIVIGGLMQTRRERQHSGIPVLKDLPLFGALFGRVTERETRAELVIFITPTIIAGQLGGVP